MGRLGTHKRKLKNKDAEEVMSHFGIIQEIKRKEFVENIRTMDWKKRKT